MELNIIFFSFLFFFRIRTLKAKYESSVPDQVLGEGAPCISVWVYMLSCSVMSDSYDPMTVAHQAPLSMGFSRQEYWSRLPFPPPGDLLDPGIEPTSFVFPAWAGAFFTTVPPGKTPACT